MGDWKFLRSVLLRTIALFLILNAAIIPLNLEGLGKISIYNHLVLGRERFPFGANPQVSYNLSLYNLDAMFASLRLAGERKTQNEFRVIVLGDSSVWGTLLAPEETLSAQLQGLNLTACGSRAVKFYNLGYPTLSVTKDLMILDEARKYQPDLVIWMVTLESLPLNRQLDSPVAGNNRTRIDQLIARYKLALDPNDPRLVNPGWLERTIWGRRRELADLLRLQLYGPLWAATGIDQEYPSEYPPLQRDFKAGDVTFEGLPPDVLDPKSLGMEILGAGNQAMGSIPVVLINEPVMISSGENSQVRYNFYYPRWAYDQYRQIMFDTAQAQGWNYSDLWNLIPENEFTNSAIHLNSAATHSLAVSVGDAIQGNLCR